jgi:ribosomal-protein-alanine N-acetyltransferase
VIFHIVVDVSEIYNIAVDAEHARSGIGKQLMWTAITASRQQGATRIVLEVRKSNTAAIDFYFDFKFRIAGERRNYYSNPIEDAYIMEYETEPTPF